MLYKTIVLELIQQRPKIYDRLRQRRMLLPTLNRLASELKDRHLAWNQELQATRPGSGSQIASEAAELAVSELEDRLSADCEAEALDFLDAAMARRRRMPPA